MFNVDGFELADPGIVVGLDLSLTAPGVAALYKPWGQEPPRAVATTVDRVPTATDKRGLVLRSAAERIAWTVEKLAAREDEVLVVIEALLLQSGTGKAPERAAFWWMVRGELESKGYAVTSVHPTTRRSLSHDAAAVAKLARMREEIKSFGKLPQKEADRHKRRLAKLGKTVSVETARRRWPSVVLPDDDAADALVCADLGARALEWPGLPALDNKNLPSAIKSLGVTKGKNA